MLLLTFLMVVSVSCQHGYPNGFPKPPKVILKQTLYEQKICNQDKTDCQVVTKCQFWELQNKEWVKIGEGPLKNADLSRSCHGSFGISHKEVTAYMEWFRQVDHWYKQEQVKCNGTSNN